MERELQIIPIPQSANFKSSNFFQIQPTLTYCSSTNEELVEKWGTIWLMPHFLLKKDIENPDIVILHQKEFEEQHYRLSITHNKIKVEYGESKGLYYAILTLGKLCNCYLKRLPEIVIEDWPDIRERGLLLDVSRGRMPKLETLYQLVDRIALLNYNQLQLYIEGPVFDYATILWEGKERGNLLTACEVKALEQYCEDRCIALVPNQNVLGHMKGWLELPNYKHLSEKPDVPTCTTLDVSNAESLAFSKELISQISSCYKSDVINVNLDEPDELGQGNSKELVEEKGKGSVYLAYTNAVYRYVKSLNKKMMMWSDVIDVHPEILHTLPKDIILLSWGYEADHNFKMQAELLKKWEGVFYLCPGTSSWLSFSGRINEMLENVGNAITIAKAYGGNVLLTDWGDGGHIQHPFVSYPAYIFAGNGMWNVQAKEKVNIEDYITYMLEDDTMQVGKIICELGNYYHYEGIKVPNQTMTYGMIQMGYEFSKAYQHEDALIIGRLIHKALLNKNTMQFKTMKQYEHNALSNLVEELVEKTMQISLQKDERVKDELLNTLNWIQLAIGIRAFIDYEYQMKLKDRTQKIDYILNLIEQIRPEYGRLWNFRNKQSGLQAVNAILTQLANTYQEKKKDIEKGIVFNHLQYIQEYSRYIKQVVRDTNNDNSHYKKLYKKYLLRGGIESE